jgi:uncharacterized protein (DUF1501 family)
LAYLNESCQAMGSNGATDSNVSQQQEIVVTIFLRGGMDGINVVPPIGGNDRGFYQEKREDMPYPQLENLARCRWRAQSSACIQVRRRCTICS